MEEIRAGVAIIGGGASGMMAAIAAAEEVGGQQVLLLEKNGQLGKKLLATGNGRCNLTNLNCAPKDYGGNSALVQSALEAFGVGSTIKTFEEMGLLLREEEQGRVYPWSGQALSVCGALEHKLEALNVRVSLSSPVQRVMPAGSGKDGRGFHLVLGDGTRLLGRAVILAAGGKAGIQYGSSGDSFCLARALGHEIRSPRPALVQMTTSESDLSELKGVRAKGKASLYISGQKVAQEQGEIQLGNGLVSGVCVFNLSRHLPGKIEEVVLDLDLFPEYGKSLLLEKLETRWKGMGGEPAAFFLDGLLHRKLAEIYRRRWGKSCGPILTKALERGTVCQIPREDLEALPSILKSWKVAVQGTRGWKEAQVTKGGVALCEVTPATMESRLVPGFYLTGEALNVDGPCGGYNLQWAWTSGRLAGRAAGLAALKGNEKQALAGGLRC